MIMIVGYGHLHSRRKQPGQGRGLQIFARIALNQAYFNLAGNKSENGGT